MTRSAGADVEEIATNARIVNRQGRVAALVATVLSPRCPLCRTLVKEVVPELRRRLKDGFELFWVFDPDDREAFEYVLAETPGASREEILDRIASGVRLVMLTGEREVPLTVVGANSAAMRVFVGPISAREVELAAAEFQLHERAAKEGSR